MSTKITNTRFNFKFIFISEVIYDEPKAEAVQPLSLDSYAVEDKRGTSYVLVTFHFVVLQS